MNGIEHDICGIAQTAVYHREVGLLLNFVLTADAYTKHSTF